MSVNLNDTVPAATSGKTNVLWQKDSSGNVSAQITTPAPATRTISTTAPLTGGGDLSANRTLAISDFTGDSGSGGAKGAVPAPASGDAAAGKFLKADGTWAAPAGTGSTNKYSTSWTSQTSVTVTHSLGTTAVIVQVFDAGGVLVFPESLTITSSSVCTLTFGEAFTGSATVIG